MSHIMTSIKNILADCVDVTGQQSAHFLVENRTSSTSDDYNRPIRKLAIFMSHDRFLLANIVGIKNSPTYV